MRVYVRVHRGASELYEELQRTPAKERAERMRILASIGLAFVRSSAALPHDEDRTEGSAKPNSGVGSKLLQSIQPQQ